MDLKALTSHLTAIGGCIPKVCVVLGFSEIVYHTAMLVNAFVKDFKLHEKTIKLNKEMNILQTNHRQFKEKAKPLETILLELANECLQQVEKSSISMAQSDQIQLLEKETVQQKEQLLDKAACLGNEVDLVMEEGSNYLKEFQAIKNKQRDIETQQKLLQPDYKDAITGIGKGILRATWVGGIGLAVYHFVSLSRTENTPSPSPISL